MVISVSVRGSKMLTLFPWGQLRSAYRSVAWLWFGIFSPPSGVWKTLLGTKFAYISEEIFQMQYFQPGVVSLFSHAIRSLKSGWRFHFTSEIWIHNISKSYRFVICISCLILEQIVDPIISILKVSNTHPHTVVRDEERRKVLVHAEDIKIRSVIYHLIKRGI